MEVRVAIRTTGGGIASFAVRAHVPLVNRATRFVVTGTALAGLGATIAAVRADVRARAGATRWIILALAVPARDRLGLPAAVPAQRGSRDAAARTRSTRSSRCCLLPPHGRARGVPRRARSRAAVRRRRRSIKAVFNLGQTMLSVVVGLDDLPARSTTARRARSRSGAVLGSDRRRRSRCLRSAKRS